MLGRVFEKSGVFLKLNSMSPRVSILFPVYNTAPFLKEAVDSMLSQTFTDFELIVLNDCSPDNAEEIMNTYNDPRIVRYRGETNVGLGSVLNVGISIARGEYIARMDSDDISLPNRLQYQVEYLDAHPEFDLVSVGMQEFGEGNRVHCYDNETEEIKFNALFSSPICHASSMWRKNSFEGLLYDQSFVPSEDYHLWTRALLKGIKMRNLPQILYRYRRFPGQSAATNDGTKAIKIKLLYMSMAFPGVDENLVEEWRKKLKNRNDLVQFKATLAEMDNYNRELEFPFFDPKQFSAFSHKFYQSLLFKRLNDGGDGTVLDLRLSQIVKLFRKKIFHRGEK